MVPARGAKAGHKGEWVMGVIRYTDGLKELKRKKRKRPAQARVVNISDLAKSVDILKADNLVLHKRLDVLGRLVERMQTGRDQE